MKAGSPPAVNFAVPTGNFGDILAGYYAKQMGLPVGNLVVCTNQNDVLHRFLQTGVYKKDQATLTIAPSMDISVSSNFERYLFYLADCNSTKLAQWMQAFESTGQMSVEPSLLEKARTEFSSYASTKDMIVSTMRKIYDAEGYLVCPHTATAVVAVTSMNLPADRTVCLATAHPAKFEEAMTLALTPPRRIPVRPRPLQELFSMNTRSTDLPNSLAKVQAFVRFKRTLNEHAVAKPDTRRKFTIHTAVTWFSIGLFLYTTVLDNMQK